MRHFFTLLVDFSYITCLNAFKRHNIIMIAATFVFEKNSRFCPLKSNYITYTIFCKVDVAIYMQDIRNTGEYIASVYVSKVKIYSDK